MLRIGLISSCCQNNQILQIKLKLKRRLYNKKVISNCYKWFISSWWGWVIISSVIYYLIKTRMIILFLTRISKCRRAYCWMSNRNRNKNKNRNKSKIRDICHHEAWAIELNPLLKQHPTTHTHTNSTNTYKPYFINKSNSLSIYSNNYNYSNHNINKLSCRYSSYRLGVSNYNNKMIRWWVMGRRSKDRLLR